MVVILVSLESYLIIINMRVRAQFIVNNNVRLP